MVLDAMPAFVVIITSHNFYCVTYSHIDIVCVQMNGWNTHLQPASWLSFINNIHKAFSYTKVHKMNWRVFHLVKILLYMISKEKWNEMKYIYFNVNYSFVSSHLSYAIIFMLPVKLVNRKEQNNEDCVKNDSQKHNPTKHYTK